MEVKNLRNNNPKTEKIAQERVKKLINRARKVFDENPELANHYVDLAWKIKTRYNLNLPKKIKLKFCRKCQTLWVPKKTCRFRLNSSKLVVSCLNCGNQKRYPY